MGDTGENLEKIEEVAPIEEPEIDFDNLEIPETGEKEPEAGKSEEPKESVSQEDDKTEFIIGESTFTKKDFERMWGRDQDIKGEQRNLHNWGQKLNTREKELGEREERAKESESLADEYRSAKKVLDANPEAYKYLEDLIRKGGGEVSPRIKELEEKFDSREENLQTEQAKVVLSKEIPDFDYDKTIEFMEGINWDDRKSVMKFQHWAQIGSQIEQKIQEKLGEQSEKEAHRPATPPLAGGGKIKPVENEPQNTQELVTAVLHDLEINEY